MSSLLCLKLRFSLVIFQGKCSVPPALQAVRGRLILGESYFFSVGPGVSYIGGGLCPFFGPRLVLKGLCVSLVVGSSRTLEHQQSGTSDLEDITDVVDALFYTFNEEVLGTFCPWGMKQVSMPTWYGHWCWHCLWRWYGQYWNYNGIVMTMLALILEFKWATSIYPPSMPIPCECGYQHQYPYQY